MIKSMMKSLAKWALKNYFADGMVKAQALAYEKGMQCKYYDIFVAVGLASGKVVQQVSDAAKDHAFTEREQEEAKAMWQGIAEDIVAAIGED